MGAGKENYSEKKGREKNILGDFLAVNLGGNCRIIRLMTDFLLANWHWVALALASGGGLAWSFIRGAAVALEPGLAVQYVERESGLFLDIRSSAEFGRGHIIRAVNLPAEEISKRAKEISRYKEKPVVTVCQNGMRSRQAVRKLAELGFTKPAVLSGGMAAWRDAHLPISAKK